MNNQNYFERLSDELYEKCVSQRRDCEFEVWSTDVKMLLATLPTSHETINYIRKIAEGDISLNGIAVHETKSDQWIY